jgi:hypothetical protein
MSIDTFSVFVPFEVLEKADSPEAMTGRIGGVISTETRDFQGEILAQQGIDWSYFLKHGWFNYEHQKGPENVLGHPETVVTGEYQGQPATRVEGVLYLHKPKAREIFQTAQAMNKAGAARNLGFSVEGQVLARDKKKVTKAKVLNVAITAHPVNPDARLEVLAKAMNSIGYQTPAGTGSGSFSPLVPQSLEKFTSSATYGSDVNMGAMNPYVSWMRQSGGTGQMTVPQLALTLSRTFPQLSYSRAITVATAIKNSMQWGGH